MQRLRRLWPILVILTLGIYLLCQLISTQRGTKYGDFRTYYAAGQAVVAGENPYSLEVLSRQQGRILTRPYLYAPAAAWLFAPLTSLPYAVAGALFLLLKVALLSGILLAVLRRWSSSSGGPNRPEQAVLIFLVALGFGGAARSDLREGNVVVLEMACAWGALLAWDRNGSGRTAKFALLMFLAGVFKCTPWLYGVLPLFDARARWRERVAATGGVVILSLSWLLAQALLVPTQFGLFVGSGGAMGDNASTNFSVLAGLREFYPADQALWMYIGVALFVLLATTFALWRAREDENADWWDQVAFVIAASAMILPRMKNYSYALLIPIGYRAWTRETSLFAKWAVLVLVGPRLIGLQPLFAAAGLWLRSISGRGKALVLAAEKY